MTATAPHLQQPTFVFAGGGSGGHLFPALAIAAELTRQRPGCRVVFVGSARAVDQLVTQQFPGEFIPLTTPSARELVWRPWRGIWQFWHAFRTSCRLLQTAPHAVVIGTGGYISVPVSLAAAWLRRPLILLEPNAVPGRATSLLARFAASVCVASTRTKTALGARGHLTGVALRSEMAALARIPYSVERRLLVVLGGSQGAEQMNSVLMQIVKTTPEVFSGWTLLHQAGLAEAARVQDGYDAAGINAEVFPFISEMAAVYRRAGIAITRAGATTLAELACAGIPTVALPHQTAVRDHQRLNSQEYTDQGAAITLTGKTIDALASELRIALQELQPDSLRVAQSAAMRRCARPQATTLIADIVLRQVSAAG